MLDSFLEKTGLKPTEYKSLGQGEISVSQDDGFVFASKDVLVSPGSTVNVPYTDRNLRILKALTPQISVRSGIAQAGLDVVHHNLISRNPSVTLFNHHPLNTYLIPRGDTRLGRTYAASKNSLQGNQLEVVLNDLLVAPNTFKSAERLPKLNGDIMLIPLIKDYVHQAGSYAVNTPINVRDLPSGVKRVDVKLATGTMGVKPDKPEEFKAAFSEAHFRLLMTPFFTTPKGVAFVIQNPDSLSSRFIDPDFEHLIIGEFSDALIKDPGQRTTDALLVKAYRVI